MRFNFNTVNTIGEQDNDLKSKFTWCKKMFCYECEYRLHQVLKHWYKLTAQGESLTAIMMLLFGMLHCTSYSLTNVNTETIEIHINTPSPAPF